MKKSRMKLRNNRLEAVKKVVPNKTHQIAFQKLTPIAS